MLGGKLDLKSELGEGSKFLFEITMSQRVVTRGRNLNLTKGTPLERGLAKLIKLQPKELRLLARGRKRKGFPGIIIILRKENLTLKGFLFKGGVIKERLIKGFKETFWVGGGGSKEGRLGRIGFFIRIGELLFLPLLDWRIKTKEGSLKEEFTRLGPLEERHQVLLITKFK